MGKQLLLTSSQLSILDTMPVFLVRNMVSMQLSHIRTMGAIKNAIDDLSGITICFYLF